MLINRRDYTCYTLKMKINNFKNNKTRSENVPGNYVVWETSFLLMFSFLNKNHNLVPCTIYSDIVE